MDKELQYILKLHIKKNFIERFFEHCQKGKSNFDDYQDTEAEYKKVFKESKYSNYASFKVCKNRFSKSETMLHTSD